MLDAFDALIEFLENPFNLSKRNERRLIWGCIFLVIIFGSLLLCYGLMYHPVYNYPY